VLGVRPSVAARRLALPVAWPPPAESAGLPPVLCSASMGRKGEGRARLPLCGPCVGRPAARVAAPRGSRRAAGPFQLRPAR
jgi:hypothetical protein